VVWHASDTRSRVFVAAGLARPLALTAVAWLLAHDRAGMTSFHLTTSLVKSGAGNSTAVHQNFCPRANTRRVTLDESIFPFIDFPNADHEDLISMPAVAEQLPRSKFHKPLIVNSQGIFVPNKIIRLGLFVKAILRPLFALQSTNISDQVSRREAAGQLTLLADQIFCFFAILCRSLFDTSPVKSATVITVFYRAAMAQIAQEKYSIFAIVDTSSTEHRIWVAAGLTVSFARQTHISQASSLVFRFCGCVKSIPGHFCDFRTVPFGDACVYVCPGVIFRHQKKTIFALVANTGIRSTTNLAIFDQTATIPSL
jgi:hypothetical protein